MYRCKECGTEYEEKPDYCDCGNDDFEAVGLNEPAGVNAEETVTLKTEHEQKVSDEAKETAKVMPASAMSFHNTDSYIPKRTLPVYPVSLAFFIICIILSLYVVFFAWNVKEDVNKSDDVTNSTQTVDTKNIPSIDKLWNNALPVIKKEESKKEEKVENIIKQIIPVQPQKKTEAQKTSTVSKPKVTKVPLTKTTSNTKTGNKTNTQTKKTTTLKQASTATKTQVTVNTQTQKSAQEAAKQKAEQERLSAEAAHLKQLQAEQAKKAAEEKSKQAAVDKQEFAGYKAQLRNTIGRKIDFTRVIGDGSCTVSFKIDSTGKLINRSFTKQSSNNTLNDAVYAAVMSTPTFNPPPAAYKNETLNLNIKFTNGNFEISLP